MFSEMDYRSVFLVYRIFGIAPFHCLINRNSRTPNHHLANKKLRYCLLFIEYVWIIFLLTVEVYNVIYTFIRINYYFNVNVLHAFYAALILSVHAFLAIITIESYCKRNVHIKILSNLHEIDQIFSNHLNLYMNYCRMKRSIRNAFISWLFLYIASDCVLIWLRSKFWTAYSIPTFVLAFVYPLLKMTLICSKYVTFGILIKYRIKAMHEILDTIHSRVNNALWPTTNDDQANEFRRMIHLNEIFCRTFDTVQLMNESFKWPISVNFVIDLYAVSVPLFRTLELIYVDKLEDSTLNQGLRVGYMFHYLINMMMVVHMANRIIEEVEKLSDKLYRLCLKQTLSTELKNFVSKMCM